jgi:hypothetical protein
MSLLKFFEHIEDNIFNTELIYRSIIIANNKRDCIRLKNLMERKDYSVYIIDSISTTVNYNNIDNRIVLTTIEQFRNFIDHIDNINGICNSSYNFIAFSFNIDDDIVDEEVNYYMNIAKNNIRNTVILDKNCLNSLNLIQNI